MSNLKIVNRLSRLSFLDMLIKKILERRLARLSKEYLDKGYPQILTYQFDHISNVISVHGLYEKSYLENIIKFLATKDLIKHDVLDVGANIGNHALFFSKYYKSVHAIEPNAKAFDVLKLNVSHYSNVKAYKLGFSHIKREAYISYSNKHNIMGAKVLNPDIESGNNKSDHESISLVKMDEFVRSINAKIGLIKIDVEGMEIDVLKGGENTINKFRPIILFEQHKKDFESGKSNVVELIKNMNYDIYVADFKPKRSPYLSTFSRFFNHLKSFIFGTSFIVEKNNFPKPDIYPMLLAIPKIET